MNHKYPEMPFVTNPKLCGCSLEGHFFCRDPPFTTGYRFIVMISNTGCSKKMNLRHSQALGDITLKGGTCKRVIFFWDTLYIVIEYVHEIVKSMQ